MEQFISLSSTEEFLLPLGLSLRKMTASDLDEVVAIEVNCTPKGWSRNIFEQSLKNNQCLVLQGKSYSRVLGFYVLQTIVDELHLLNICISAEYQKRGWGKALLRGIIADAEPLGIKDIHLEVRATNLAARNLYHSLGFNDVGLRANYYSGENGREDALQMCYTICF